MNLKNTILLLDYCKKVTKSQNKYTKKALHLNLYSCRWIIKNHFLEINFIKLFISNSFISPFLISDIFLDNFLLGRKVMIFISHRFIKSNNNMLIYTCKGWIKIPFIRKMGMALKAEWFVVQGCLFTAS